MNHKKLEKDILEILKTNNLLLRNGHYNHATHEILDLFFEYQNEIREYAKHTMILSKEENKK